jgi:predicted DNA-binding protein
MKTDAKPVSFRLSEESKARLERIAKHLSQTEGSVVSQTAVVQRALREMEERLGVE